MPILSVGVRWGRAIGWVCKPEVTGSIPVRSMPAGYLLGPVSAILGSAAGGCASALCVVLVHVVSFGSAESLLAISVDPGDMSGVQGASKPKPDRRHAADCPAASSCPHGPHGLCCRSRQRRCERTAVERCRALLARRAGRSVTPILWSVSGSAAARRGRRRRARSSACSAGKGGAGGTRTRVRELKGFGMATGHR
jgi:hypothetical protein